MITDGNLTMTLPKPPYNMFSCSWDIHGSRGRMITRNQSLSNVTKYERHIDSLISKLWSLESSIKTALPTASELPSMWSMTDVIGEIEYVKSNIGIWSVTKCNPRWQKSDGWIRVMLYGIANAERTKIDDSWNAHLFGGEEKEGTCIVMLSPQCVHWLNKVSTWIGE